MTRKVRRKPPAQFTSLQMEWMQCSVEMIARQLGLKVIPQIITDRKHFDSYFGKTSCTKTLGECMTIYNIIWISAKHHANAPVRLTLSTLIHECIHLFDPDMSEEEVEAFTMDLMPMGV